jgi:biotin transport system substrate-specific component
MNKELSEQLTPLAASRTPAWLRSTGIVLAASALVAACAHISLPLYFPPVPLNLAPFAVLLMGLALSPRRAFAALIAYLAEGAAGLPVFAPSPLFGLAHLLGPTGGYLIAYPLAAALVSLLKRPGFAGALTATALGDLAILTGGALWLAVFTHASVGATFTLGILPFLPGDALKVVAAAALVGGFERLRRTTR